MTIYTKSGDAGQTGLFGGERVSKADPRVRAYGAVDELGAVIGVVLSLAASEAASDVDASASDELLRIQDDLFTIGARLASADPERALDKHLIPDLSPDRIADLERAIDALDERLPALDSFVLSGGSAAGAQLHVARTVCRRAERAMVMLAEAQPSLEECLLPYVNRLSDYLFVLARATNHRAGTPERRWTPQRRRIEADEAEDVGR